MVVLLSRTLNHSSATARNTQKVDDGSCLIKCSSQMGLENQGWLQRWQGSVPGAMLSLLP